MNPGDKQSILDSLNLLMEISIAAKKNDLDTIKRRMKDYTYISDPKFIMELEDKVNNF